ncbi:54S ribosomal protein L13 [Chamberlinius hualienensis]
MSVTSNFKRVQQWNVISRLWYLYDCKLQKPFDSAYKIAMVNIPYAYAFSFARELYYCNVRSYPGGASWTLAWELHAKNPTMVMYKAVYKRLRRNLLRRQFMPRLHLYPNDKVPKEKYMRPN